MTAEEKREKNREYYERRKEELKRKARDRYRRKLKIVKDPTEEAQSKPRRASNPKREEPESIRKPKRTGKGSFVRKTRRPIAIRPNRVLKKNALVSGSLKNQELVTSENTLSDYGPRLFSQNFQLSVGAVVVDSKFSHPHIDLFTRDFEDKAEKTAESEPKLPSQRNYSVGIFQLFSQFFRIVFGAGLTTLLILLQIEFYEAHDPSKYSIAMAIGCELSLIALSMTKFRSWFTEGIKRFTYTLLFCYIVGSLGFASYHSQRETLAAVPYSSQSKEYLLKSLNQAEKSLAQATKHGSWDNMKLFGNQVEKIRSEIKEYKPPKAMGLSNEEIALFTALLFIILRAGFVVVNSLNAVKIREVYEEWKKSKECLATATLP